MQFKVFPAHFNNEKQKVPLISNWNDLATDDPAQIRLWQETYRERLNFFGIPCGPVNNILVLDIDIKTNGWKTIQENNFIIPDTFSQTTVSGGKHFFFKYDPARDPGNKVGFLPGLDIRSKKGWVAYYGIDADFSKPILDAPEWLYEAANRKKADAPIQMSLVKLAPEIAEKIFKESIDAITHAPEGESNNVLNTESFKVGQLVASGSITREFAAEELFKAAKLRGKPDYEARATIKSGLDGGVKNPLSVPFGQTPPVLQFEIPEPIVTNERWTPGYLTRYDLLNKSKLRKPQLFRDWSTTDITITTADGGTGKTTLMLNEAIALALGDRFLGFDNKIKGKTLYVTGEDTDKKLAAMLGAIIHQMGLLEEGVDNDAKVQTILSSIVIKKDADLCLIAKDKQGFLGVNPDAMKKLQQAVEDIRPVNIIFDPIASFWGSESALNDMNKAVTKFMSWLCDISGACVHMINHMGKSSSANKDMTQFAGRGGSGLPSNSRVSRVLRSVENTEFKELTGFDLVGDQSAMMCNVNKFSDGSPLFNKPFLIIRNNYLFSRITLTDSKTKELEKHRSDDERIFGFVKREIEEGRNPTRSIIKGHFMTSSDPIAGAAVQRSIDMLVYQGYLGDKLKEVANVNLTVKERMLVIIDETGREI